MAVQLRHPAGGEFARVFRRRFHSRAGAGRGGAVEARLPGQKGEKAVREEMHIRVRHFERTPGGFFEDFRVHADAPRPVGRVKPSASAICVSAATLLTFNFRISVLR